MSKNIAFLATQEFVLRTLENHDKHEWTTMSFGMIRTYLDPKKRWRLNVWDDRLQVPNVSIIHDHPWSFGSLNIVGELTNIRYNSIDVIGDAAGTHLYHKIVTGEGGGPAEAPRKCRLIPKPEETYFAGGYYHQYAEEVHETSYLRGTVTLNDRTPASADHTARVFWPVGTNWVDAMPRIATSGEIRAAIDAALERFK